MKGKKQVKNLLPSPWQLPLAGVSTATVTHQRSSRFSSAKSAESEVMRKLDQRKKSHWPW